MRTLTMGKDADATISVQGALYVRAEGGSFVIAFADMRSALAFAAETLEAVRWFEHNERTGHKLEIPEGSS